jgi:hypothetical protein
MPRPRVLDDNGAYSYSHAGRSYSPEYGGIASPYSAPQRCRCQELVTHRELQAYTGSHSLTGGAALVPENTESASQARPRESLHLLKIGMRQGDLIHTTRVNAQPGQRQHMKS